ncbi:PLP-dependent transferase [Hesseltinella vesiculosa]|uniref:PLP-dependent transferase n=1 Tax=Hesseltinella vesiculosa TaxID=101127 RepID=A0A1X2G7H2_9FUNG|nr:PLP-dependent transferase [Hesseltinella vesiculosa]
MDLTAQLDALLQRRQKIAKLRRLVVNDPKALDFSSNDFLGLAASDAMRDDYLQELQSMTTILGSTGSRLLDGNSKYAEDLERTIADFHGAPSGLIFNSGFDANVGLLSSVPQKGDIILYDELIHASSHEGMRLSRNTQRIAFQHSNVNDLAVKLDMVKHTKQNVFVAIESVYSMDGDVAPLREMSDLLLKYWPDGSNGFLIVDEAHATGVFGDHGKGVVCQLGLENRVFARIHTFSKALAGNGAAILGSDTLRQYLINYARPLIYSTFMPFSSLALIQSAYRQLASDNINKIQSHLQQLIERFRSKVQLPTGELLPSTSPIQGVVLNGNRPVRALAGFLNERGFIVKPICSPTVPRGQERVRICFHGHNTLDQVNLLVDTIHSFFEKSSMESKL